MSTEIIQERLFAYQCQTVVEQQNALKEIAQEIALMGLSRAGLFQQATFQGGTCLRILYGLDRFSEDLDFTLEKPDKNFYWDKYLHNLQEEFSAYGYTLELQERKKLDAAVKIAFLKADSAGGLLLLKDSRTNKPKLKIKLEIDTNPPAGAMYEIKYLDFPLPYNVKTHNMPSLFAGKCHALLCRNYAKGRDWYDFLWYVARKTPINFVLLSNAIEQVGPWQEQHIIITSNWLLQQLEIKIDQLDWEAVKQDVSRFLKPRELATLQLWSRDFFLSRLEKLANYLAQPLGETS